MQDESISLQAELYIVQVLCSLTTASYAHPRSLHLNDLLRKGLDSKGFIRHEYLRIVGDLALFISGIFPESFNTRSRRIAYDVGYYIDIGQMAYDNIQVDIFEELAENFPKIVDILNDLSLRIKLSDNNLAIYLNQRRYIDARAPRR